MVEGDEVKELSLIDEGEEGDEEKKQNKKQVFTRGETQLSNFTSVDLNTPQDQIKPPEDAPA